MRRTLAAAAVFLVVVLTVTPAEAGIFDRFRDAGKALAGSGNIVLGTALTPPVPVGEGTQETEVLVFSTTIGKTIERVRFPASDLGRVTADVRIGSTIGVVTASAGVGADGYPYVLATRWRSSPEGNPTRAAFLQKNRLLILAYALRGKPDVLAHFCRDALGELRQLLIEIDTARDTANRALLVGPGGE